MLMHLWVLPLLSVVGVAKRPNILFIVTDDQDKSLQSTEYMPILQVRYF